MDISLVYAVIATVLIFVALRVVAARKRYRDTATVTTGQQGHSQNRDAWIPVVFARRLGGRIPSAPAEQRLTFGAQVSTVERGYRVKDREGLRPVQAERRVQA